MAVIRVFDISTYIQIHREGFWDSLSRQLQRRGPDYISRCTHRNEPLSIGDNVILPAQFPPSPYKVQGFTSLVEVSEEDRKNVSEMTGIFQIRLSSCAIDLFHACVRSLNVITSLAPYRVTSLDKFVTLSQVSSFDFSPAAC